jgi:membrane-bound lytic murein transglycosylase F
LADQWQGLIRLKSHLKFTRIHDFQEKHSIHWMVHPNNKSLNDLLHVWTRKAAREDYVLSILDKNRSPFLALDKMDVSNFSRLRVNTLPIYKDVFQNAGMIFDLPWELIAAISFQESKWNPEAVSFTGVKGLMQITKDTEKFLGIRSRQDPIESIWGGAKYVRFIYDQMSPQIDPSDRISLTLAAYNIGLGHLRDAQKLVERRGKNPNSWKNIKEVLPLLEKATIGAGLQYGVARGGEALAYVERVRGFLYYLQN